MKIFHCDHCYHLVFFENIQCLKCEHLLAFLPELEVVGSLDPAGKEVLISPLRRAEGKSYRLCANYSRENVCNWAVLSDDPHPLCQSCRLTRVIPDLNRPGHKQAWYRLEVAKRRMVYSLLVLRLPILNKTDDPEHGLAFEFLSDSDPAMPSGAPILTGHNQGVITINVAEADDAERERRRLQLHEPYRTLLGHFRHEVGHYYWDRLIKEGDWLDPFRQIFGDERQDYSQTLKEYYAHGAPENWQERFVSAYASAHPWEDWAETWAHYLHMTDALETAAACGLSLKPPRPDEPSLKPESAPRSSSSFDRMINSWFPLTYVLNNLNRGLGLADGYPFVLSAAAIGKLRFVHDVVTSCFSEEPPTNPKRG